MKFRIVIFLIIFIRAHEIHAQSTLIVPPGYGERPFSKMETVDSGRFRVWYAINAKDIKNQDTFEDLHRLDVGSHISAYYSYFLLVADSLVADWYRKNRNAQSGPGVREFDRSKWNVMLYNEYHYSFVFKDFSAGVLTVYSALPRFIPNFHYTDNMAAQDWIVHDDTATVAGYLCQKAVCSWRGRDFEAWFAPNIPVGNGPWKFGGLPGLILKIYDTDHLYVFECIKIETFRKEFPVRKHEFKDYVETDRKKFRKLVKDMYNDYSKVSGSPWRSSGPYDLWELE